MKKIFLLVLACCLLCGCGKKEEKTVELVPLETPAPTQETAPDVPHNEVVEESWKMEGYSAEQLADYFCEVVLASEYSDGTGDTSKLQKWKMPIYYRLEGDFTSEDKQVVEDFAAMINDINGFPGMYPAKQDGNLHISFLSPVELDKAVGYMISEEGIDGAVIWDYYTDTNEIHQAKIWIRNDVDQDVRNSVILEEIVNAVGMGNDTDSRTDSIIYQGYSTPQQLSAMDWALMRMLYSEKMKCGMTERQCRSIIEEMCG